jgi:hypothetical protein
LAFYKYFYSLAFYMREMGEIESSLITVSKIRDN